MRFYFYDLETSGISPRHDRIMQFAGQATDRQLKPVGKPDNLLVKLSDDVLPQPDAILTHNITPQRVRAEGLSEPDFLDYFSDKIAKPDTIFVGYNNIRFDDEFMRFTLWRNFYDAYEWQWKAGRGRWDLLDTARMTRALRPDGIKWPFASDGKPTVGLAALAAINKLTHDSAHDALSDIKATIAVARLLRLKQPKLFDYLLNLRDKAKVEALITARQPIVYASGRYPGEYLKTTVATMIGPTADKPGALMYDLRIDPDVFIKLAPDELAEKWAARGEEAEYFPVKTLSYNRAPAVAPLNVLDKASVKRIKLDMLAVEKNLIKLRSAKDFAKKLNKATEIMYGPKQPQLTVDEQTIDTQLYEGFVSNADRTKMSVVRATTADDIAKLQIDFEDPRLELLLRLYKARNFAGSKDFTDQKWWQNFKQVKLIRGGNASHAAKYFGRIEELKQRPAMTDEQKYILEELEIYGQSILPADQLMSS